MSVSNVLDRAGKLYKSSFASLIVGVLLLIVVFVLFYMLFFPIILGGDFGDFEVLRSLYYLQEMMATPIVQLKLMVLGVFISCAITPLSAGFYENFKKVEQGEPASVNNLFTHYNSPYTTARLLTYATLFTVATSLFSLLVNLLGLPILSTLFDIFASLLLTFAVPIIIFENQSVEQAVRGSIERVMRNFGTVFLSGLVGGIIAVLGVLLFGIGLIFSLPFLFATLYALYAEERGITPNNNNNL